MKLRMIIFGVLASTVLMVVMVLTRLITLPEKAEEIELTRIEPVMMTPPAEPEVLEEVEPVEVEVPPPALELETLPEIDVPMMNVSEVRVDPSVEVELFSEDVAVSELPVVKREVVKVERAPVQRPSRPAPTRKIVRPEPIKSSYSVGELDGVPGNVRVGSLVWPSGVRDDVVRASVQVEIDEGGRVNLISVSSLSNPRMRSALVRLVKGSRFTVPRKNGRAVKARYSWPLTLKKPR